MNACAKNKFLCWLIGSFYNYYFLAYFLDPHYILSVWQQTAVCKKKGLQWSHLVVKSKPYMNFERALSQVRFGFHQMPHTRRYSSSDRDSRSSYQDRYRDRGRRQRHRRSPSFSSSSERDRDRRPRAHRPEESFVRSRRYVFFCTVRHLVELSYILVVYPKYQLHMSFLRPFIQPQLWQSLNRAPAVWPKVLRGIQTLGSDSRTRPRQRKGTTRSGWKLLSARLHPEHVRLQTRARQGARAGRVVPAERQQA